MTLVSTIPAGARGYDALGDVAGPTQMAADGWSFRTFYISQRSAYAKIMAATPANIARIQRHLDAGIGVLLNFESKDDRWTQGYNAGHADGVWSRELCATLGYPDGLAVLISYDTNVSVGTLGIAIAYGEGFDAGLGPRWTIGVYGENSIMAALADRGVSILGWNVMASSWDQEPVRRDAVVHVQQRRPTTAEVRAYPYVRPTPTTWSLDVNDAKLPFNVWLPKPDPTPPAPAPVPDSDPGHAPATPTVSAAGSLLEMDGSMKFSAYWHLEGQLIVWAVLKSGEGAFCKVWMRNTEMWEQYGALLAIDGQPAGALQMQRDPEMFRAMGPVVGPIPEGHDGWGVPLNA